MFLAAAASYPKKIGPFEASRKTLADGGTRRTYNGTVDQYVDTPNSGLTTWAAGGPTPSLLSAGYQLQFQIEATDLEGPTGAFDICRLRIAGAAQGVQASNPVGDALPLSGASDVSNDCKSGFGPPSGGQNVSGSITFGNYYTANTGNTSHTGDFILRYQYARA